MANPSKRKSHDGSDNIDVNDRSRKNIYTLCTDGVNYLQQPNRTDTATTTAALQLLNLKPLRDLAQNFDIDIASR